MVHLGKGLWFASYGLLAVGCLTRKFLRVFTMFVNLYKISYCILVSDVFIWMGALNVGSEINNNATLSMNFPKDLSRPCTK
jgi:hypothetical protein